MSVALGLASAGRQARRRRLAVHALLGFGLLRLRARRFRRRLRFRARGFRLGGLFGVNDLLDLGGLQGLGARRFGLLAFRVRALGEFQPLGLVARDALGGVGRSRSHAGGLRRGRQGGGAFRRSARSAVHGNDEAGAGLHLRGRREIVDVQKHVRGHAVAIGENGGAFPRRDGDAGPPLRGPRAVVLALRRRGQRHARLRADRRGARARRRQGPRFDDGLRRGRAPAAFLAGLGGRRIGDRGGRRAIEAEPLGEARRVRRTPRQSEREGRRARKPDQSHRRDRHELQRHDATQSYTLPTPSIKRHVG